MTASRDLAQQVIEQLRFDDAGLIPAIAQSLAWMNADSVRETLATGRVCYWSRSRQRLWRKGETSGHTQRLVEMRFDCDSDALLLLVDQTGPACHTNRPACFFHAVQDGGIRVIAEPVE